MKEVLQSRQTKGVINREIIESHEQKNFVRRRLTYSGTPFPTWVTSLLEQSIERQVPKGTRRVESIHAEKERMQMLEAKEKKDYPENLRFPPSKALLAFDNTQWYFHHASLSKHGGGDLIHSSYLPWVSQRQPLTIEPRSFFLPVGLKREGPLLLQN